MKALLPIAHKYGVRQAKPACEKFMQSIKRPPLEMLTLAYKYNLEGAGGPLIERCFREYNSRELDEQRTHPANKDLPDKVYLNIFR